MLHRCYWAMYCGVVRTLLFSQSWTLFVVAFGLCGGTHFLISIRQKGFVVGLSIGCALLMMGISRNEGLRIVLECIGTGTANQTASYLNLHLFLESHVFVDLVHFLN